ncbi:Cocaine esterase [Candidatus Entotheonellaceae bacterium PAL068K]
MPESVVITLERHVPATMRDGTVLYADIWRPRAAGQYPVILSRLPYNKEHPNSIASRFIPWRAAEQGYVVIFQDTRGRWTSDGTFYPFRHEIADGYDTVEWAAALPYSNGKVGMIGASYVGATQWLAAFDRPPHLTAIIPAITASDYHEGWAYQGGAFELGFNVSWTAANLGLAELVRRQQRGSEVAPHLETWLADVNHMCTAFAHLPLKDYPTFQGVAPYYFDWLAHPDDDAYWQAWNIEARHSQIAVPALNIGGWYDIFLGGTLRNYLGMRANGGSPQAREGQRLLIGPWLHGPMANVIGEIDFGVCASGDLIDVTGLQLHWLDYWLKGLNNGVPDEPPVRLFVMGDNAWRDEQEWPLARTQYIRYYLHSQGQAQTRHGDGVLNPQLPGDEPVDSYVYDPRNPVPTRGGGLCCWPAAVPGGAFDQRSIQDRPDVLVYSTPPLEREIEVTGPITVTLWATSTASDTDFTAKLVDVHPNGYAQNLTDGILRARYRESTKQQYLIDPGCLYEYSIDLWATSNVFKAGHAVRVEISSSNFPRFDRNPNTGRALGQDAALRPALQTVYHDRDHPSHLTLPVIPR